MRLFLAINLNDSLKNELMYTISVIKGNTMKGSFTKRANLHITLAFIGEVSQSRLRELIQTMNKVRFHSFSIKLSKLGQFCVRGELLYYRYISYSSELISLQQLIATELKKASFSVDEKEFIPHITLARRCLIKDNLLSDEVIEQLSCKCMVINEFSLMKSERLDGKLIYTKLHGVEAALE